MSAVHADRDAVVREVLIHPWVRRSIRVPAVVIVLYALVAGEIADLELFIALVIAGGALALGSVGWAYQRSDDLRAVRAVRTWQMLSGTVGVGLLAPLLNVALTVDVELFAPMIALILIAGAYTYPTRWRIPLSVWTITVWLVSLWWWGIREPTHLLLHLGGGALVVVVSMRVADALAATAARAREARRRAELRAELLATLLRTLSLDPQAVLQAVVRGLADVGFEVATIRTFDPIARSARLADHVCETPLDLVEEVSSDLGLLGVAVREQREVVVDDLDRDPRALDHGYGLRGAYLAPLRDRGAVVAVLSGASRTGPLSEEQIGFARELTAVAERALARARAYDADRRTVEELRRLDDRAQDFVSTVSHELRTPLTVIQGLAHTLTERWDVVDDERRTDLLHRIDANADRLAVMVRSLLDSSALERGELDLDDRDLVLAPAVAELLDRLATVTAEHRTVMEIPDDLQVHVDPALFEHVLENLLTNVAKHTPPGTCVTIGAERLGDRVRVAVVDDGPGISPEDLPHVLDRFYRGGEPDRRETGGLGLGLALARQIVQAHGSELVVRSVPGQGTEFAFTVPAVA